MLNFRKPKNHLHNQVERPRNVDLRKRGRQVLASGRYRTENRGVKEIFIACVDGLKGFPEAIEAIFPKTQIQLLYCTYGSLRPEPRLMETAQKKSRLSQNYLPSHNSRTGKEEPRRLRL